MGKGGGQSLAKLRQRPRWLIWRVQIMQAGTHKEIRPTSAVSELRLSLPNKPSKRRSFHCDMRKILMGTGFVNPLYCFNIHFAGIVGGISPLRLNSYRVTHFFYCSSPLNCALARVRKIGAQGAKRHLVWPDIHPGGRPDTSISEMRSFTMHAELMERWKPVKPELANVIVDLITIPCFKWK
jgi:hypothetical protein